MSQLVTKLVLRNVNETKKKMACRSEQYSCDCCTKNWWRESPSPSTIHLLDFRKFQISKSKMPQESQNLSYNLPLFLTCILSLLSMICLSPLLLYLSSRQQAVPTISRRLWSLVQWRCLIWSYLLTKGLDLTKASSKVAKVSHASRGWIP